MSIEQARTCRRCQFENPQPSRNCQQCGAEQDALSRKAFLLVASIAAAPLMIPTLLAPGFDDDGGAMYGGLVFFLMSMLFMGVYLVLGASISAALFLFWKNGSAALSVLVGLGIGLLLGAGSCTAYLAVTS